MKIPEQAGPPPRRPVGAAVDLDALRSGHPGYARTLRSHFDSVTPENDLKWATVEPEHGRFDFARGDAVVAAAVTAGQRVRGHTLVWHEQLPTWVSDEDWSPAAMRAVLADHVAAVARHYRGRVAEWDVVNEPLTAAGGLRRSVFERVLGPDYIGLALRTARRADPGAALFINEFANDLPSPKTDGLVSLAKSLLARQVPLDGVGLQMHLDWRYEGTAAQIAATMRRFTSLGLEVAVTELDVTVGDYPGTPAAAAARQAAIYGAVGRACVAVPQCTGVTTWGLTDARSWRGPQERALPFDDEFVAKPAWLALRREVGIR